MLALFASAATVQALDILDAHVAKVTLCNHPVRNATHSLPTAQQFKKKFQISNFKQIAPC